MKNTIVYSLLLFCFLSSCETFLTIEAPEDKTVATDFFSTKEEAEQAVIGIYVLMRRALAVDNAYLHYGEIRTGLLYIDAELQSDITDQNLTIGNETLESLSDWGYFYDVISQCNYVLEELENIVADELSTDLHNQLKGETLVLKSMAYFYLLRIWGNVPLLNATSLSPQEEVLQLAISLAKEGLELVPDIYLNDDGVETYSLSKIRVNKSWATVLLAQEYIWMKDYSSVKNRVETLLSQEENGEYKIISRSGFDYSNDYDSEIEESFLGNDYFRMDIETFDSFYVPEDPLILNFSMYTDYVVANSACDLTSLFTRDDLYLLLAEALYFEGEEEESKKCLIDIVTAYDSPQNYSSIVGEEILEAIYFQRERLLLGTGYSFFDLIRTGRVSERMSVFSTNDVENGASYWPLSIETLTTHNFLSQNPYWLTRN